MNKLALILSVSILFTASVAGAATSVAPNTTSTTHSSDELEFKTLDLNHDGYLEKVEATQNSALNKQFENISTNGKLDLWTFEAWKTAQEKSSDTD